MPEDLQHKQFAPYVPKKGEEYMSDRQLAHFRNILETLKAELMQDIERTVHTMQDEATVFADPNDRASQETDIAIELRNRDRERKLIKKIEETIAQIDSGDYGYCTGCGAVASRGAACATRARTRSSRLLRAASYARFKACSNASTSAEPWLLNTRPRRPSNAAPL